MPSELHALCFDAHDPAGLARFWGGVLEREVVADAQDGVAALLPATDTELPIRFLPSSLEKWGPNQMHFDLTSSSQEEQERTVTRVLELGGRHIDVGQTPEEEHVVLADPEGNELCVIEAGNSFLDGCGVIGALSSDGTQQVGYFWSEALGWPLVWDQDEETAIQSPLGGTKITWGGPPVEPRRGKNRLHLDLVASAGSDHQSEVERLLSIGATRVDVGQGDAAWTVLADPGGNELCLYPSSRA